MVSYWERRLQDNRQRSLQAQSARLSGQAAQFDNVSRTVGQVSGVQPNSVLEAQRRRREQAERDRLARVQREQAEARAAAARADRERREILARNEEAARRAQENAARGPGFVLPTGGLGPGFQPTMEDYAQAGRVALGVGEEVAFGPERQSVFGGEASRPERTLRDWGLSEQEFRAAGEAFGEGRPLAGAGWGLLGLAGAVPFLGQVGRGVTGAVRGAGAAADISRAAGAAADVARGAGNIADLAEAVPFEPVRGQQILDDVTKELIENGTYRWQKPDIESVPVNRRNVAELAYRQNYEALPRAVDAEEFRSLASSSDATVLYRGINDAIGNPGSGMRFAEQFVNGDYFVGWGIKGHGIYVTDAAQEALEYAANSERGGAVVRMLVSPNARFLKPYEQGDALIAFENSPFNDISEWAIANGYDGIDYSRPGQNHFVILNRSVLTADRNPLPVSVEDADIIYGGPSRQAEVPNIIGRFDAR